MKADLSPAAVSARLLELRAIATLEDVETTRRRLEADHHHPSLPFAEAVARRLEELRALYALTVHLHSGTSTSVGPSVR